MQQSHSIGVPDHYSVHMELQHHPVRHNFHLRWPSSFDLWNVCMALLCTLLPAELTACSVIVAIGQTLVMASLAEYCSLWPNAGGQLYYTMV
jgi:hypothetical protein